MSLVSLHNLAFAYDTQPVLEHVSLEVNEHDFLAIIGPNGGGKSTLLKLMLGLLKPTQGSITLLGTTPSAARHDVGYVPQNTNVNTDFPVKVLDVVLMGNGAEHHPLFGYGIEEKACAMEALQQVGMEDFAARRIGDLSGGQRQAVSLLMATLQPSKILLLDEHTAALDPKTSAFVLELTRQIIEEKQCTALMVTHSMKQALAVGSRTIMLHQGQIIFDIRGEERARLGVKDLLDLFSQSQGETLDDDALLLG